MDMVQEQVWSKDFIASPVLCLAFNNVTQALVGGQGDGEVTVWDAHAPHLGLIELFKFSAHHFSSVLCLDFRFVWKSLWKRLCTL